MKNLLLILLASFALLFVLGQFGQGPDSGQGSDPLSEGGLVDNLVNEAQVMINKGKPASNPQKAIPADEGDKASAMPHEGQVETAVEASATDDSAKNVKPLSPVDTPPVPTEQNTHFVGDIPAPNLADVLSGQGPEPAEQKEFAQDKPAEPAVHRDRHSIEEVIALSRDNASRFRRIHSLINGD